MPSNEKVLEVNQLKTSFFTDDGEIPSVNGVSFSLKKGKITAIVGESGSGKSVTSYSIMRLLDKSGKIVNGKVMLNNQDLVNLSQKQMRKIRGNQISMIFQEPLTSLNPVFKIGKQLAEAISLHEDLSKKEIKQKGIDMLEKVGISRPDKVYDSYPHLLSGGMRQRVMIAIALACNPSILIADEPTTALDVTIQSQILDLLNEIKNDFDTSILLITHDLGVVAEIADEVLVMYAGKIVEDTNVYDLFNNPKHPYTKGLLSSTPKIKEDREVLGYIKGTVPTPKNMPKGCKFHPRCPYAMEKCVQNEPELIQIDERTKVRCWLFEDN